MNPAADWGIRLTDRTVEDESCRFWRIYIWNIPPLPQKTFDMPVFRRSVEGGRPPHVRISTQDTQD